MPGAVILQAPPPPQDSYLGFCAVCAGVGKFEAMRLIKDAVDKHERAGEGVRRWPLNVPPEFMQRAVAWGVVPAMGAALPLCWSHLAAIQPSSGGIIPAGFMPNGGQNVPLLGQ